MRARLSIFFGRLSLDLPRVEGEKTDLREWLDRAAAQAGHKRLGTLLGRDSDVDADSFAAVAVENPEVFGELESQTIARGVRSHRLSHVAARAAEHYGRVAQIEAATSTATVFPTLSFCVLFGLTILFSTVILPRFTEALHVLGAPQPFLTRCVVYTTVLFKVVLSPVLLSAGLLTLVLVFYWRSAEGKARLSRLLLRAPWFGELFSLWAAARFCSSAVFGVDVGDDAKEALTRAAEGSPCGPLKEAMVSDPSQADHRTFAALRAATEPAETADEMRTALLGEMDWLGQQLARLSQRIVVGSQILLVALTVGGCLTIVLAMYLPVAQLHDSVMR